MSGSLHSAFLLSVSRCLSEVAARPCVPLTQSPAMAASCSSQAAPQPGYSLQPEPPAKPCWHSVTATEGPGRLLPPRRQPRLRPTSVISNLLLSFIHAVVGIDKSPFNCQGLSRSVPKTVCLFAQLSMDIWLFRGFLATEDNAAVDDQSPCGRVFWSLSGPGPGVEGWAASGRGGSGQAVQLPSSVSWARGRLPGHEVPPSGTHVDMGIRAKTAFRVDRAS